MLIDVDPADVTNDPLNDNTAEKIFSASSNSALPLLPTNSISITRTKINNLSLEDSNPITKEDFIDESDYYAIHDIKNYNHFKRKKNLQKWEKRNSHYLKTHPADRAHTNNISQHAYIEEEDDSKVTYDGYIYKSKITEWDFDTEKITMIDIIASDFTGFKGVEWAKDDIDSKFKILVKFSTQHNLHIAAKRFNRMARQVGSQMHLHEMTYYKIGNKRITSRDLRYGTSQLRFQNPISKQP
jgi:hypothetical protein